MSLSKADQQKAVANAKSEISAFSDMYNRSAPLNPPACPHYFFLRLFWNWLMT